MLGSSIQINYYLSSYLKMRIKIEIKYIKDGENRTIFNRERERETIKSERESNRATFRVWCVTELDERTVR